MTIKSPDRYLIQYRKSNGSLKYYKIAPIHVTEKLVTGYVYADGGSPYGIKSFKQSKITQIELLKD